MLVFYALLYKYGPSSHGFLAPKCDFISVSLFILGIGSFAFHASLRQNPQFVDDLPLNDPCQYPTTYLRGGKPAPKDERRRRSSRSAGFHPALYVWSGEIIYRALAFVTQTILIALRGLYPYNEVRPRFPEANV